jgi:uncharacterized membrane protein
MTAAARPGPPPSRLPLLVRVALLGLATGGRSTAPLATLAWSSSVSDPTPVGALASPRGRLLASLAAAGEGVIDKLPGTPSRLSSAPLAGRLLAGAAGGLGLALRSAAVPARELPPTALLPAVMVGGGSAVVGSYLGAGWRSRSPLPSDLAAAAAEDLGVAVLSWAASR